MITRQGRTSTSGLAPFRWLRSELVTKVAGSLWGLDRWPETVSWQMAAQVHVDTLSLIAGTARVWVQNLHMINRIVILGFSCCRSYVQKVTTTSYVLRLLVNTLSKNPTFWFDDRQFSLEEPTRAWQIFTYFWRHFFRKIEELTTQRKRWRREDAYFV